MGVEKKLILSQYIRKMMGEKTVGEKLSSYFPATYM